MASIISDPNFMEQVVVLLLKDRQFLRQFSGLLAPDDFKPRAKDPRGEERWIIASKALAHFEKHGEPLNRLLTSQLEKHAAIAKLSKERTKDLLKFGHTLVRSKAENAEAVTEGILDFKRSAAKAAAIEELLSLGDTEELTDQRWNEICQGALDIEKGLRRSAIDYLELLEARIERRNTYSDEQFPLLFIDQVDMLTRAIARGTIGLIAAPWKRGKSLCMLWIAFAYALQNLRVLWVTLEDPQVLVEDRLDSAVTFLPIEQLASKSKTLRKRFNRVKSIIRGRISIYDGTDEGVTIARVEQLMDEAREEGRPYDAVFIDYDDEIIPRSKHKDRRFEFAEIYRDMRRAAAKHNAYWWTAAQTTRGSASKKIITGEDLAEDVSKARKVSFALGLGVGDWGEESIYAYVMAHKMGKQHIGCNIMTDLERMCFYDRKRSYEFAKRNVGAESDIPEDPE